MRRDLLELAHDLARRGEAFALAVVVARRPPISAQVGDAALVTASGEFHGWVGGSCTRPTVIAEAKSALLDGHPRLVALGPDPDALARPGVLVFPMSCHSGGSVEIHIQPVLPRARFVVYGMSPTARALCRLAVAMDYEVVACDEFADPSAFPGATVVTDPNQIRLERGSAPVFAVVATHGEWDEKAVLAALAQEPSYLGVVASSKRFSAIRAFVSTVLPNAALANVKNPAGLDIGALSPEEIAISILAQVVTEQRAAGRPDAARAPGTGRKLRLAQSSASAEERDPVCGMMVRVEGAAFHASHQGVEFYFCCAGCRDRFTATPERYLVAGAAP